MLHVEFCCQKGPHRHGPAQNSLEDATWLIKKKLLVAMPATRLLDFRSNECGIITIAFNLFRIVHAFTCAGILPRRHLTSLTLLSLVLLVSGTSIKVHV